jgi:hypothetical protein
MMVVVLDPFNIRKWHCHSQILQQHIFVRKGPQIRVGEYTEKVVIKVSAGCEHKAFVIMRQSLIKLDWFRLAAH